MGCGCGGLNALAVWRCYAAMESFVKFDSFRKLVLHCLECHERGESGAALELIDGYLSDPRAKEFDAFWSAHHHGQALGWRSLFLEALSPEAAAEAVRDHLEFSRGQMLQWMNGTMELCSRVAIERFQNGDIEAGKALLLEAIRLAGVFGFLSPTTSRAAEEAKKAGVCDRLMG